MSQQINRIQPQGDVHQYQTYSVRAGNDKAVLTACKDAGCDAWAHGWDTRVDERTTLGEAQAAYIRGKSGRTFTEMHTADGLTVFRFEAFQRCFANHYTKSDIFIRRHGDWRGNPSGNVYVHTNALDWANDFAEHQDTLDQQIKKG